MSGITERLLLNTPALSLRDIRCDGACRHKGPKECATAHAIVFPYRGLFVRHLDQDVAVAEANQALFFNPHQEYSVSHPVAGGDACLSITLDEEILSEIVPRSRLASSRSIVFREQRARIGPAAQSIAALLRHGLRAGTLDPLQAETLALSLVRHAVVDGNAPDRLISAGKRKLIDRAKRVVTSDLGRRWTLSEIGEEVGCSPVYLTQLFQQIEGMPLYRYQLQLRLAKALEDIARYESLTMLALDLGFSSHSHFTTAFRATYGRSPSAFRHEIAGTRY